MEDHYLWVAISKLLLKFEWQEIGKLYDTGDRQEICPVCRQAKTDKHSFDCELAKAISEIGSKIYE